ncbi:MAG: hypothetical protein GDA52_10830 [Rhodobacteraceae bacterium]|nr:hypothetical protein [Paracoccaceae bacterium]
MSMPDNHSIARQLAVLEERMNTHQADYRTGWEAIRANMAEHQRDYRTDIARLAEDMARRDAEQAKRDADLKAEVAKRDADAAKRDKDNQRFLIALFGVFVAIFIGSFVVSNIVVNRTIDTSGRFSREQPVQQTGTIVPGNASATSAPVSAGE